MSFIEVLVGSQRDELKACTLADAYPRWLTKWVSHLPPRWHTTEYRTVPAEIISPGVCPRCLLEDLANKRSQHLRLSWYCSATTVCPQHFSLLVPCCHTPLSLTHEQDRLWCARCRRALDEHFRRTHQSNLEPVVAVAYFERMLRSAIDAEFISTFGESSRQAASLLGFVEDMAWALMRPVAGTPYRILHAVQRSPFLMPFGFNTPVDVPHWLSAGCLQLRRCIFAILASLLLPETSRRPLTSAYHSQQDIWAIMKSRHSPEDEAELRDRANSWDLTLRSAVRFRFYR